MADSTPTADGAEIVHSRLTTTRAIPPGDYKGEAAMKVFGVPELLEHILYMAVMRQQAKDTLHVQKRREYRCVLKMWPMPGCGDITKGGVCLFRIQRVSKTFRDTIQGSIKLKQLIYLAPQDNRKLKDEEHLNEGWLPLHKPLTAFLWGLNFKSNEDLLDLDGRYEVEDGVQTLVTILSDSIFRGMATPYDRLIGKCPAYLHRAQASWRNIKVCNAKVPAPVRVVIQGEELWPDCALPMDDVVWDLDAEANLGHVFDLLSEFLQAIEELRQGKNVHDEYRDRKYLEFDNQVIGREQKLEDQLAIECEALEAVSNEEAYTEGDDITDLRNKIRDEKLLQFEERSCRMRQELEDQLAMEREALEDEMDEEGFRQGDEITERIRLRVHAVETRRAQQTACETESR